MFIYQVIIFLVIQHIPAFMALAPLGANAFGFDLQHFVESKVNPNLVIPFME